METSLNQTKSSTETNLEKDVRVANEFIKTVGTENFEGLTKEQIYKIVGLLAIYPRHLESKGIIKFTANRN